jgi:small subunit ribosomal protein S16
MAVKIRLRREGRKKTPMFRIVVADSKAPRDGRFIEIIGQYQPRFGGDNALNLQLDRVNYWMDVGAEPSDTVRSLLRRAGVMKARHETRLGAKLKANAVAVPSDSAASSAPAPSAAAPAAETPPTSGATPMSDIDVPPTSGATPMSDMPPTSGATPMSDMPATPGEGSQE